MSSDQSSDHIIQVTPGFRPTPYQLYSALPVLAGSDLIRVLDLSPLPPDFRTASTGAGSSATCNVPLAGTLRIVKLTDNPKFAVLSYVWGNEKSPDHTLAIRTTRNRGDAVWKLNLTKNCHGALVHLRQQFGAVSIRVDSICINQQDNEEKNAQIPLMEQIFTWANPVYVWLGQGSSRSDRAMDTLSEAAMYDRDLVILKQLLYPNEGTWTCVVGWLRYLKMVLVLAHLSAIRGWQIIFTKFTCSSGYFSPSQRLMSIYDAEFLESLLASHHRKWSQRVWTLQELLLAGNIVVVCGNKAISWDKFMRGLNYIQQMQQLEASMDIRQTLSECVYEWCLLLNLWLNFGRAGEWNGQKKRYSPSDYQRMLKRNSLWACLSEKIIMKLLLFAFVFILSMEISTIAILSTLAEKGNWRWALFFILYFPVLSLFYCFVLCIGRHFDNTRITLKNDKIHQYSNDSCEVRSSITQKISTIDIFMREVRQRVASDPKDKSYAMYGILKSFGASLSPPKYEKPLDSVFRELFSDLVTWNSGFMRLLMDVKMRRDPQMEHAPTWVPEFHECTPPWLDSGYYDGTNHHSATSRNERPVLPGAVATSTYTRVLATVDGRFLRAAVQRHGTVLSCSGAFRSTEGVEDVSLASQLQRENISKFLSWFFELRIRTPCTPAYDSSSKAVLHVLEGRTTIPPNRTDFNKWYRTMINLLVDIREVTRLTNGEFIYHAVEALESDPAVSQYFTTCCNRFCRAERNLFISSCGYIGSGPDIMVNGDVVALVPGVPVPMIFRSAQGESSQYTIIGPAFVHGLMMGEDWDEHQLEEVVLI